MIGLQTALTLLEEGREAYNVYVVAELLPGDESGEYASAWYVDSSSVPTLKKLLFSGYDGEVRAVERANLVSSRGDI